MNLTYTPLQTIAFGGLVVMAVLGVVQWGDVDIRLVFGIVSIVVGLTFSYLIGREIVVDIQTIRRIKEQKVKTKPIKQYKVTAVTKVGKTTAKRKRKDGTKRKGGKPNAK